MFSTKMVVPIRFNLSCFEVIINWAGELEYVYTNDDGAHYFSTCDFVEICRAFDSVQFTTFVEAHNECVEAYEGCGSAYGELIVAYGCNANVFTDAIDEFEKSIEHRIECKTQREIAHTALQSACFDSFSNADLTFYTLCEIGSRMLGIEYDDLAL